MKKISLKSLNNLGIERMSRENLKNVLGGSTWETASETETQSQAVDCVNSCGGSTGGFCPPSQICRTTGCSDINGYHSVRQCFADDIH